MNNLHDRKSMRLIYIFFLISVIKAFGIMAPITINTLEEQLNNENSINFKINIDKKEKDIAKLVYEASDYFLANTIEASCNAFTNQAKWYIGEACIFLLDPQGNILCHGDETELIWKNIDTVAQGITFKGVFSMLKTSDQKGNWFDFKMHNGYKSVFVRKIIKNNIEYLLGAGFFPESKEYSVKRIAKNALNLVNHKDLEYIIPLIQSPFGPFVKGDNLIYMIDFNGQAIADPATLTAIGQNMLNYVNDEGVHVVQEDLRIAKSAEGEGWVTYNWKKQPSRHFIQKITDKEYQKDYLVGVGYYTDIRRKDVVAMVHRAISHLKSAGAKTAFPDFSNGVGNYVKGPLTIFVYDFEGNSLANGENASLVGQNLINRVDGENKLYVKQMIEDAAKYGKGFLTIAEKNDYKTLYFETVDLPDGKFIVGSGFFPSSKSQSVKNMVGKGIDFLRSHNIHQMLQKLTNKSGEFLKGDVSLFIYDDRGILLHGPNSSLIWKNFSQTMSNNKRKIVQELIDLAKSGGGWVIYQARNAQRCVYVKAITKQDTKNNEIKTYIVGSGYFV